jgi:DNA polymerase-3 subunit delta'
MEPLRTFGHQNVKNLLDLQLKSGKFSHAYLFTGPEGVGKKILALELAGKILGTDNLSVHPDFAILDQTEDISVERIQQFMEGLSFKPFLGKYKVAIVNNAHLMNTQSSNALLKTLEEPSASTILILVSANKNLLPTIVSRCQTFFLNSFTVKQLKQFADERNLRTDGEILKLSFGSVARLMALQDKTVLVREQNSIQEFEDIKKGTKADRLLAISKFAELETPDMNNLFRSWLFWQRQALNKNANLYWGMSPLLAALDQLNTNKNKKLILQDLFLKI